ncbi:hypothetical protein HDE_14108 [Halotydeus destructor]|nr:hypothetical protein HDE_14108 [Halotydeus destructor]
MSLTTSCFLVLSALTIVQGEICSGQSITGGTVTCYGDSYCCGTYSSRACCFSPSSGNYSVAGSVIGGLISLAIVVGIVVCCAKCCCQAPGGVTVVNSHRVMANPHRMAPPSQVHSPNIYQAPYQQAPANYTNYGNQPNYPPYNPNYAPQPTNYPPEYSTAPPLYPGNLNTTYIP